MSQKINQHSHQKQNSMQSKRYSFRILTEKHADEAMKLVQQVFNKSEPLRKAFFSKHPQRIQDEHEIWRWVRKDQGQFFFRRGCSIGCFDLYNNEQLIGITLEDNLGIIPQMPVLNCMEESILPAFQGLVKQLYGSIIPEYQNLMSEKKKDVIEHLYFAIREDHQGRGLLQKMVALSDYLASLQNFEYSICWVSNTKTGKTLKKHNYFVISQVDAKTYELQGIRPFEDTDEEEKMSTLWFKKLQKMAEAPYPLDSQDS